MFYRPNFCCSCGEKIERVEWSIFSSRKFCDLCQTEFRAKDLGPKILAAVGLVFITAVASSIFSPARNPPKAASSELVASAVTAKERPEGSLNTTSNRQLQSQSGTNVNASRVTVPAANVTKPVTAAKAAEPVYYCGAATKKGTACSRRVKHPGERCWQHQGMPSVIDESGTPRK